MTSKLEIIHYHITIALSIKKWNCRKDRNQTNTSCLLQVVASRTPAGCEEEDSCRCEAVNGKKHCQKCSVLQNKFKSACNTFCCEGPPQKNFLKLIKIAQNCHRIQQMYCEVLENFLLNFAQKPLNFAQKCSKSAQKCSKSAQKCSKSAQKCSKSAHNCSQYIFFIWRFLKILLNFAHFAQIWSFLVNCPLVSQRLKFKLFQHLISIDNWLKSICQVLRHL